VTSFAREELRRGWESLDWDYRELRHNVLDTPKRAQSVWLHIRSNAEYAVADARRVARRLPIARESSEPAR
jgi:hypothetical protein